MTDSNVPAKACDSRRLWIAVVVLLGILVTAEGVGAWVALRRGSDSFCAVARNSLCAVTLAIGEVCCGFLIDWGRRYLRLADVYYVQNDPSADGRSAQFRLVSCRKTDWHSPDWMAIPTAKILNVENVEPKSRLADLIVQDRGTTQPDAENAPAR